MPGGCLETPVLAGSASLIALGALAVCRAKPTAYGKHSESQMPTAVRLPAGAAWFLQELPSFVVPAGILALQPRALFGPPGTVLLGLFCAHYFHRTFIYSMLTRGRPFPAVAFFRAAVFCFGNGFLQSYYLIYCAEYPDEWYKDVRFCLAQATVISCLDYHNDLRFHEPTLYSAVRKDIYEHKRSVDCGIKVGIFLFILGMGINIHSDFILRQLRKPGEVTYRIPQGGLFSYVSGANFFGEIVEWFGYALASWSLPALAFAFFSLCFLGVRAFHHHRFYLKMFEDYPRSRRVLIPFIF